METSGYRPDRGRDTEASGVEVVRKAIEKGIGVWDRFIDRQLAAELGAAISAHIPDEDLVGIPVFSDANDSYGFPEDIPLTPDQRALLGTIEQQFTAALCQAAGVSADGHHSSTEVIKYVGGSMDWHTDNYKPAEDVQAELRAAATLNGVVTLSGNATYYYMDPETGNMSQVLAVPGKMVMSRSGDIGDLKQLRHSVGAPATNHPLKPGERVVLLIKLDI